RSQLARPVDRDSPRAELTLEGGDRLGGGVARMDSGLDRVVLGGQAEGVIAHRVQHPMAGAPVEVRYRIAYRVFLEMADMRLAAWIREHLEHVGGGVLCLAQDGLVRDLPGVLLGPHPLPAGLDLLRVVAALCHWTAQVSGRLRTV